MSQSKRGGDRARGVVGGAGGAGGAGAAGAAVYVAAEKTTSVQSPLNGKRHSQLVLTSAALFAAWYSKGK